jgi:hypothetical protein
MMLLMTRRTTITKIALHHTLLDKGVGVRVGVRRAGAMGVVAVATLQLLLPGVSPSPSHLRLGPRERPSPVFQLRGRHQAQAATQASQPKA